MEDKAEIRGQVLTVVSSFGSSFGWYGGVIINTDQGGTVEEWNDTLDSLAIQRTGVEQATEATEPL